MVTGRKSVDKGAAGTTSKRTAPTTSKRAPRKKTPSDVIDLGDALIISNVLEWHGKLCNIFAAKGKIVLDGGNIEQIDGTGLQLLVALIKQAGAQGMEVSWKGVSETLRAGALQLALSEALHLDAAAE
jgi:anti-anti-sigma regulatory factor